MVHQSATHVPLPFEEDLTLDLNKSEFPLPEDETINSDKSRIS
jgi:hypothetical protein